MATRRKTATVADPPILSDDISQAIAEGRLDDPFAWLGLHETPVGIRAVCFDPGAAEARLTDANGTTVANLEWLHPAGVFGVLLKRRKRRFDYRFAFHGDGKNWSGHDPYAFGPVLGDLDLHLIGEGKHRELYRCLGAHPCRHEGVDGTAFAVWAPNARRVSITGDFNFWDGRRHPMRLRHGAGVWEIFIPDVTVGARYKYEIVGPQGELLPLKADPFSFQEELAPATASVVHGLRPHEEVAGWNEALAARNARSSPISIYEVHLGSWRRGADGGMFDYDTLAETLVDYALDMGFTHLEFLPVSEHPFSGSWGYARRTASKPPTWTSTGLNALFRTRPCGRWSTPSA